jgi:SHS2 domain-containing protein
MSRHPWEEIEHTADWALRVWGEDRRALFENTARGMLSLIGGEPVTDSPSFNETIELRVGDWETLLVDWLSELLYRIESRGVVITKVAVHSVADLRLRADVCAVLGANLNKHIKAVTYHNLAIQQTPQGYEVTIVFDV